MRYLASVRLRRPRPPLVPVTVAVAPRSILLFLLFPCGCVILLYLIVDSTMTLSSTIANVLLSSRWFLVIVALAAYVVKLYRDYDRLKDFKGPWATPWTSFWLVRAVAGLQTHAELYEVCRKYGKYNNGPHMQLLCSITH